MVQPFNEPVVVSVVGIATQLWCALFRNFGSYCVDCVCWLILWKLWLRSLTLCCICGCVKYLLFQHNLVGRLLGPKGLTLKRMQAETQTKMSILGRGSMRDKQKEEELRNGDDPSYSHLKEDLHVLIEAVGPYSNLKVAAGLAEIKKMLIPPVSYLHTGSLQLPTMHKVLQLLAKTVGLLPPSYSSPSSLILPTPLLILFLHHP